MLWGISIKTVWQSNTQLALSLHMSLNKIIFCFHFQNSKNEIKPKKKIEIQEYINFWFT